MRFYGLTLAASMLALGACGGNKDAATTDTTAAMAPAATMTDTGAMAAPAAGGAMASGATATMAPITGTTHEVKMIGDAKGYRFEPANITVKAGDGIKFTNVSGGPHNFALDETTVPAAAKAQLSANMPNQMAELSGPLLTTPNETYTVSFANVPAGTYNFHCTPHLAMGMKGVITVQ
jgi:plastocyanin